MPRRSTQVQIDSTTIFQDYEGLAGSFRRGLVAENKSPQTVKSYMTAVEQLGMFLAERRMPRAVASITREHVQEYITGLIETRKPATATNRFRSLHVFFAWLIDEGEITASPMEKMHAPSIPEEPPATLTVDHLHKLIAACKGKEFADVRDTGILLLFIDTGMRISELSGLTLSDVDLDEQVAAVIGKGRRPRVCPFGNKTARALDRYLRARTHIPKHKQQIPVYGSDTWVS